MASISVSIRQGSRASAVITLGLCGGACSEARQSAFTEVGISASPAPCVLDYGVATRCGVIDLPEDYAKPHGRRIRLPYMMVPATQEPVLPDPILFVPGGPGASAIVLGALNPRSYDARRDQIFLEVRGASFAEPSLECPELAASGDDADAAGALVDCHTRLTNSGVDLAQYRTGVAARDIAEARRAMGYESWNLYGGSYGTTLAQVAMQADAAGIRSVMLDAPSPPQVDIAIRDVTNTLDQISNYHELCSATPDCSARITSFRGTFEETLRALAAEALTVGRASVDGAAYFNAVASLMQQGPVSLVPWFIELVAARDSERLEEIFSNEPSITTNVPIDRLLSIGLHYSVYCADLQASAYGPDVIQTREPWPAQVIAIATPDTIPVCSSGLWPVPPSAANERDQVSSDIPTLIAYGALDPSSSRFDAEAAAGGLSRARILEIPRTPHGFVGRPEIPCSYALYGTFLGDSAPNLDLPASSCLDSIPPLEFVFDP